MRDYGKTGPDVYKTTPPNSNGSIDPTEPDAGALVLVCNRGGKNWSLRRPLFVSEDNGKTWRTSPDPKPAKVNFLPGRDQLRK